MTMRIRVYPLLLSLMLLAEVRAVDSDLSAPPLDFPLAQSYLRSPRNLTLYVEALRDRMRFLQEQNEDLKSQIVALNSYRTLADTLQKRLDEMQQAFSDADQDNRDLQTQLQQNEAQMQALLKQQAQGTSDLQRTLQQVKDQLQICEQAHEQSEVLGEQQTKDAADLQRSREQAREELQESGAKMKSLSDALQKMQASYESGQQQLLEAQQKIEQLQKGSKNAAWFDEQIQNKNKKISQLNAEISDLNQSNYTLNQSKTACESQLQDKTKRLGVLEATNLQQLKESKAKEANLQSEIQEKTALVVKWRQDYDTLKSQLDAATSLNNELRQKIKQLEKNSL